MILCGDYLQLSPVVASKQSCPRKNKFAEFLSNSLLARAATKRGKTFKSRSSFRMPKKVAHFLNTSIYGGILRSHPPTSRQDMDSALVTAFRSFFRLKEDIGWETLYVNVTSSKQLKEPLSKSSYNPATAATLLN